MPYIASILMPKNSCDLSNHFLSVSATFVASIPYRQCLKYFYQYIDHLAVPIQNPCSLFSLAEASFPRSNC